MERNANYLLQNNNLTQKDFYHTDYNNNRKTMLNGLSTINSRDHLQAFQGGKLVRRATAENFMSMCLPPTASHASDLSEHLYQHNMMMSNGNIFIEEENFSGNSMPRDRDIEMKFSEMLENMILPPERITELQKRSKKEKLTMIQAQNGVLKGKHGPGFYLEQLDRHRNPQLKTKNAPKKLLKGLIPIEILLTSLEVDLRSNPNATWLREFIDEPHVGHLFLLTFLKFLQDDTMSLERTTGRRDDIPQMNVNDEHLCLLCIKAIMKNKFGFQSVMNISSGFAMLARSLRVPIVKSKIVVLKIFAQACDHPNGQKIVLEAMEDFKLLIGDNHRFGSLIRSIQKKPAAPAYQVVVLEFFNGILGSSTSLNQRVAHQQELENAGFSPELVEESLEGTKSDAVLQELKTWRSNYIDVSSTVDEFVTLRSRTRILRDEVNLLQSRLEVSEKDKAKYETEKKELIAKVEDFQLRAVELQGTIEQLKKHRHERAKGSTSNGDQEVTDALEDAIEEILRPPAPPVPPPAPPTPNNTITPPPPMPVTEATFHPPPPAAPPINANGVSIASLSKVRLPILNWNPIHAKNEKSIFDKDEVDSLQSKIDFTDFERIFELKNTSKSNLVVNDSGGTETKPSQITLLNPNRARNLAIAKRRINKNSQAIKKAINHCDLAALPAEHAELLLKFIPTKEEVGLLAENAVNYVKLAEAEKFLFEMCKIERYESKLSVMVYIGIFDELVRLVVPQIDAIYKASVSIMRSQKLKKVFEMILVYGNYLNRSRRGMAHGFKLESLAKLEDTKSQDRQMSFLQYLVHVIHTQYPEFDCFYDELQLEGSTKAALQIVATDVQSLRKGLDTTKSEKEKQPKNYIIYSFYSRALLKVQQISEKYRKMDDAYKDVCAMLNEDSKVKEPSELFGAIIDFVNMYKKAERENMSTALRGEVNNNSISLVDIPNVAQKVANEAVEKVNQRKANPPVDYNGNQQNGHVNGFR